MFKEWGFLLTELWVLLALAALIGLIAGWIIWGRRDAEDDIGDADRWRMDLDRCRAELVKKDATIAELNAIQSVPAAAPAAPAPAPTPATAPDPAPAKDYDGDGVLEGRDEGEKPATLDAARDGLPDDLKRIKGIGPKLEKLCNSLGFWHFDQIAGWSDQEIAWVDANLEGFKGRVSRDNWVAQAKLLASGADTEFSRRVDKGEVY